MRDVSPELGRARHDFPEVGVQLRCAARDVERGNARPLEKGETRLEDRAWHLLDAIRPGVHVAVAAGLVASLPDVDLEDLRSEERKSTRLNSSHGYISYAVFCL